jgi:hypothetical protein
LVGFAARISAMIVFGQAAPSGCKPCLLVHNSQPNCRLIMLQSEVSKLEAAAEAAAEVPEVAALSSAISKKQQQLEKLESRLNGIKDRLFADFRSGPCDCLAPSRLVVQWHAVLGT